MKAVPTSISLVFVASIALSGCKKEPPARTPAPEGVQVPTAPGGMPSAGPLRPDQKELPPGHPPIGGGGDPTGGPALGGNTGGDPIAGKIKETMDAGSYTYVLLTTAKGEVWAAVPKTKVAVGDEVKVVGASLQKDFNSPTLKRTFPEIWFGTLGDAAAAPAETGDSKGAPPPPPAAGPVPKADGPNAKTIGEVFADPAALTGKDVAVRGRVVKYNEAILGKNWIHLQDGSGDAAKGTNDLTFTTQDKVTVGEVVTLTGKVGVNQDFGAGYKYPVIVEQATVAR